LIRLPHAVFRNTWFIALLAWGAATATVTAREPQAPRLLVYCSAAQEQCIDVLSLHPETGALTKLSRLKTPGEPAALAVSPNSRFLFASMRSTGKLCSFRIDPTSGALQTLSVVEAGEDPAQITLDKSGDWLMTAYYVAAKVTVHRISRDGTLSPNPAFETTTREKAHAIVPDAVNRHVYVPHTGPNLIFQFEFHPDSGKLSPLQPPQLMRPTNTGPRHLAWHPSQPIAYINNEQGSSVTAYHQQPGGQLLPGQTVATLPPDAPAENSTAEIQVHPGGRFLYVANRGHDSLALVRLDSTGGELQLAGNIPTQSVPRSFDLDPDGRWLLAAGEATGGLEVFRVHPEDGQLTSVSVTPIGPKLWWVLCVTPPALP
jgi:6-phosphogluconolactonase